jgi:hypothetical protein
MSDDIRRAFDEMLAPPHPALGAMVRARLEAGAERRQAGTLHRLAKFGVAAVILVVGALSISVLNSGTNRVHQQPGQNGVMTSPSPSPSAMPSETPAPVWTPVPDCNYTLSVNVLTVTFGSLTAPGPTFWSAPIRGSLKLTDRLGDHRFTLAPDTGQTIYEMSVPVSPPVVRVGVSLESSNQSLDSFGCFPGYMQVHSHY